MANEQDKQYIETLRETLRQGITRVPPAYANWSHDRSVAFKECISKCKKVVNKQRVTEHELSSAISLLGTYWG